MTDTPPDWVLIEAAKRSGREGTKLEVILDRWYSDAALRALCDMIQKYEKPPVDRKVLCAREAVNSEGYVPEGSVVRAAIRAIDLYLEGFGE
jgi:hypothetical protein